jgi:6-pyruvoyltetrahydropterin/6-carboxytetrahydropterin synthase
MRVTKIIKTETAHRLFGYKGACSNIHGHSYVFEVTMESEELSEDGMVIDFKTIKEKVGTIINTAYDHAIILNAADPLVRVLRSHPFMFNVYTMARNPTVENMLLDVNSLICKVFPGMLCSIKIWETATSNAELIL